MAPHPVAARRSAVGEAAAVALAAVGSAAASLWKSRGGAAQSVRVATRQAAASLRSYAVPKRFRTSESARAISVMAAYQRADLANRDWQGQHAYKRQTQGDGPGSNGQQIPACAQEFGRYKSTPAGDTLCSIFTRQDHRQAFADENDRCNQADARNYRKQVGACLGDVLKSAALMGHGISMHPYYMVSEDLASGNLVAVLPQYKPPSLNIYLVYPTRKNLPVRVKTFVTLLREWAQATLPSIEPDRI